MTKPVHVRTARESDDLDALNAGNVSWFSAASTRSAFTAGADSAPAEMYVAERDGVLVGYAHAVAAGIRDGHRALALIFVPPAHRGTGVGTALWRAVRALCTPDRVTGVMLSAALDDEVSQNIALAHGWVRRGTHVESALQLDDVSAQRDLAKSIPRPLGVVIRGLSGSATEQQWRTVFAVHNELSADAPDHAAGSDDMPYAVFRNFLAEPWQVLLAVAGDRIVGLTAVDVRDAEARSLHISFTGVARDFRGLGLSVRLKATHAIALHKAGWRSIATTNMDNNPAILAVNARLGYARTGGRVDLSYDYPER